MEKKRNKYIEFIKNHKKEFILGGIAALAVVGGIAYIMMDIRNPYKIDKKHLANVLEKAVPFKTNDISAPWWNTGELTECWSEAGYINLIVNDVAVAEMGKLGEELLLFDGVTPDTLISAIIGVIDDRVTT